MADLLDLSAGARIEELFAVIAEDASGNEGICSFESEGKHLPMIVSSAANIAALRPLVRHLASLTPCKIKLIRFRSRQLMEQF